MRHQQRPRAGLEERARQSRQRFRARLVARDGIAGGQHDPVGIELELRDLACGQQAIVELRRLFGMLSASDGSATPKGESAAASRARPTPAPRQKSVSAEVATLRAATDDAKTAPLRAAATSRKSQRETGPFNPTSRIYGFARASSARPTSIFRRASGPATRAGKSSRSTTRPAARSMPAGSQPVQRHSAPSAPSSFVA
jgi:hypothetical protein